MAIMRAWSSWLRWPSHAGIQAESVVALAPCKRSNKHVVQESMFGKLNNHTKISETNVTSLQYLYLHQSSTKSSPLLYTLHLTSSNRLVFQVCWRTVELSFISSEELVYLKEVESLTTWCHTNCLQLNVSKTKKPGNSSASTLPPT